MVKCRDQKSTTMFDMEVVHEKSPKVKVVLFHFRLDNAHSLVLQKKTDN